LDFTLLASHSNSTPILGYDHSNRTFLIFSAGTADSQKALLLRVVAVATNSIPHPFGRAAIITFNLTDFVAAPCRSTCQIEVIRADDFIMDVGDLSEKRATAFRELWSDTKNPPCEAGELTQRFNGYAIGDLCKHFVANAKH
jgi:hypothetical protein